MDKLFIEIYNYIKSRKKGKTYEEKKKRKQYNCIQKKDVR